MKNKHQQIILLVVTSLMTLVVNANSHPVTVSIGAHTTNPSLFDDRSMKIGETLAIQQDLSKHIYYSLSATVPQNDAYTLESDLGVTTAYKRWLPFAELEGVWIHQAPHKSTSLLDYDFGTAYQLTPKIYPLIGFDGIGLRGEDAMKYGAMFQCTKTISITADAIKYLRHKGSGVNLTLAVTL